MGIDKDDFSLTNEVVKRQYEALMKNGMPFLQIFPEMIQEPNVAETFKNRAKERNKSLTQDNLDSRNASVEEFRENLFLQIFPEMIQESNVAETFKIRQNKNIKYFKRGIILIHLP